MQCSNTYRISHFLYRNTYRIAIILYRGNPTHVFFTFKFTNVRARKRFRKMAITQVILVLKLNVAHKKNTLCNIMSRITSLLFVTQNVIDYNWDLLDESFCDVIK